MQKFRDSRGIDIEINDTVVAILTKRSWTFAGVVIKTRNKNFLSAIVVGKISLLTSSGVGFAECGPPISMAIDVDGRNITIEGDGENGWGTPVYKVPEE